MGSCSTCATVANQDKLESGDSLRSGLPWQGLQNCKVKFRHWVALHMHQI